MHGGVKRKDQDAGENEEAKADELEAIKQNKLKTLAKEGLGDGWRCSGSGAGRWNCA